MMRRQHERATAKMHADAMLIGFFLVAAFAAVLAAGWLGAFE